MSPFDSKKYQAEWYQRNKEHRRKYQLEYQAQNPGWHLKSLMKRKYGITIDDYNRMLETQAGLCAICKQPPLGTNIQNQRLHVDHDEATGRVRGLLCGSCNRAIGLLQHNIDFLATAIDYLSGENYGI